MGWAAELLYRIASYHKGVASTVSTSACHPAAPWTDDRALTNAKCWRCSLQPHHATCYVTQEKTQHILESVPREQYTEQNAFSRQRHHALACGSVWVWWRLHWVRLLSKGASQPLIGLNLFIPPPEMSPIQTVCGRAVRWGSPHPGHSGGYALGRLTKNKRSSSFKQNVGLVRCTRAEKGFFFKHLKRHAH